MTKLFAIAFFFVIVLMGSQAFAAPLTHIATPCAAPGPWHLIMDSSNIYWTDFKAGTVLKTPIGGGHTVILASGQPGPCGIAVDKTTVYWTNNKDGTIMKVAIQGGTPVAISSGQDRPAAIVVAGGKLYCAIGVDHSVKIDMVNSFGVKAGPNGSGSAPHCPVCPIYCTDKQGHQYICGWYNCGPCTS